MVSTVAQVKRRRREAALAGIPLPEYEPKKPVAQRKAEGQEYIGEREKLAAERGIKPREAAKVLSERENAISAEQNAREEAIINEAKKIIALRQQKIKEASQAQLMMQPVTPEQGKPTEEPPQPGEIDNMLLGAGGTASPVTPGDVSTLASLPIGAGLGAGAATVGTAAIIKNTAIKTAGKKLLQLSAKGAAKSGVLLKGAALYYGYKLLTLPSRKLSAIDGAVNDLSPKMNLVLEGAKNGVPNYITQSSLNDIETSLSNYERNIKALEIGTKFTNLNTDESDRVMLGIQNKKLQLLNIRNELAQMAVSPETVTQEEIDDYIKSLEREISKS